jgi:hypothetical protein
MTRWDRSDDPIPEGHIRRSEAFEVYYRKVTPNAEDLEKAIEAARARRGSAENAPKRSAWKPARDEQKNEQPLSKAEENNFLGALPKTEKAFWKAEKAFYAATEAKDDARKDAAKKFIAALVAGELQPMIRKRGSNQVLSRNMWDIVNDVIPLLDGLDGIVDRDRDRTRPVFFNAGEFQDWFAKQGTEAATAAPKVGPDGGRPSPDMPSVEGDLDQWIDGGTTRIKEKIRRWTPKEKRNAFSNARLARALAACRNAAGGDITASAILRAASPDKKNEHKSFPGKFKTALDLI